MKSRKEALLEVIEVGRSAGEALVSRVAPENREQPGTYETWSTKDAIGHTTEWLARDLKKLDMAERPIPAVTGETIDATNIAIYDTHAGKSWDEMVEFFRSTFDDALRKVGKLSEDEVNAQYEDSDGSSRPVWRMIGGHALMHLAQHFALVYRRMGASGEGTEMEEQAASVLRKLDDSPQWQGTTVYNLACNYSLSGNTSRAIELLKEALGLNPDLAEWAKNDDDLDSLRNEPEYKALFT